MQPKQLLTALEFPPNVAELIEAFFRSQPLRGSHGAFGVSLARLGVVAQIDSIGERIKDQFMHPDRVALAKGDDFKFLAAGLAHNLLHRDCRSRRSIFLLPMMTLENLAGVIVFQCSPGSSDDLEEHVYADGKVRSVEKARFRVDHHFTQTRHLVVPASVSDNEILLYGVAGVTIRCDR